MKLLIADDEELTRTGLITSIDWEAFGIHQIFQADDGLHALQIARAEKPDIILSDIRMPRLSGIQMAEQLETLSPDTILIFMSGYSDKEYLKAAIRLRAINYVEKPLNPDEIKEAVQEAVLRRKQLLRTHKNEDLYFAEKYSRLAHLLTKPYREHAAAIQELLAEPDSGFQIGSYFITYIIKLRTDGPEADITDLLRAELSGYLQRYHLRFYHVRHHAAYHIIHITGDTELSSVIRSSIEEKLKELTAPLGDYYIGEGDLVHGISKVYQSYTSAVVALQSSFFYPPGSVLTTTQAPSENALPDAAEISRYTQLLLEKNQEACSRYLAELYARYDRNTSLLPNLMRDYYYKLFAALEDCRQKCKISSPLFTEGGLLELLGNCFTYKELHQLLSGRTAQFFECVTCGTTEDRTVFLIKDYIHHNYANESLSIKEISDHVHLSASYVCTYFKTQTGQTLNQYLTEYRMEKATRLLADARYQIADISSRVGYNNGNYFGKTFKKYTGLSPSKYREKVLG